MLFVVVSDFSKLFLIVLGICYLFLVVYLFSVVFVLGCLRWLEDVQYVSLFFVVLGLFRVSPDFSVLFKI